MSVTYGEGSQRSTEMRQSAEVRDTLLSFYEMFSAPDLEGLARIITQEADESVLVIGTDPGDWLEGRERWIAARKALMEGMWEGLSLEAGEEPRGYEEGLMGWVADRPSLVTADGTTITTRLTGVVRQEGEGWRLVHVHLSVGVPDEEVVELQKRWSS
jgi:ketosteroid isomerase-like protein